MKPDVIDCVIIGAGPAGLMAATYLARFRRSTAVFDDGASRARLAPNAHNVPGFPDGVSGNDLLHLLRVQAERYGTRVEARRVTAISRVGANFLVEGLDFTALSKTVLVATGNEVVDPPMSSLVEAISRGAVRYCPICDGYEVSGMRIAVLGGRKRSIEEALFLRTYTSDLTYIAADRSHRLLPSEADAAAAKGIRIVDGFAQSLRLADEGIEITLEDGVVLGFDCLYPCLGSSPRSGLVHHFGVSLSKDGGVLTDAHQRTSVTGIYAAGDVLHGLDQISSACGQGAIAATAIHNDLR